MPPIIEGKKNQPVCRRWVPPLVEFLRSGGESPFAAHARSTRRSRNRSCRSCSPGKRSAPGDPHPPSRVPETGPPVFPPGAPASEPGAPVFWPGARVFNTGAPVFLPGTRVFDTGAPVFLPGARVLEPRARVLEPDAPVFASGAPSKSTGVPVVEARSSLSKTGASGFDLRLPERQGEISDAASTTATRRYRPAQDVCGRDRAWDAGVRGRPGRKCEAKRTRAPDRASSTAR